MHQILPTLFLVLAGLGLLGALLTFWQSLRGLSGAGETAAGGLDGGTSEDRVQLLEEKKMLLQAIKDIELEHALGKLSDEDYAKLDQQYRTDAKQLLQALDEQARPFMAEAESLIAKRWPVASRSEQAAKNANETVPDAASDAEREGSA